MAALDPERHVLNRVIETTPTGIVMLDRNGVVTFCNSAAETILGLPRQRAAGRSYDAPTWRITDLDGSPFPREALPFQRILATGLPVWDVRHAIQAPDGRRTSLRIHAAPLFDTRGAVDGMVATVEDITTQAAVERSLAERIAFEKLLLDLTTRLLALPPSQLGGALEAGLGEIARLSGADHGVIVEIPAGTHRETLTHEWREPGSPSLSAVLEARSAEAFSWWYEQIRSAGFILLSDSAMLPDDAVLERRAMEACSVRSLCLVAMQHRGSLMGFVGIASRGESSWKDETVSRLAMAANAFAAALVGRRAEEALLVAEMRAQALVIASPMGIHMYDLLPDGRLVFVGANPAADAILGVSNSQFVGKTIEEAFPPLTRTEVPERYRRAAALGESWQTRQVFYQYQQISGAYEVYAFQTKPGSMAALFLDITARLRAEEQLRLARFSVEHALDAVFWADAEGRIVEANEAACHSLGYTLEELRALCLLDLTADAGDDSWPERWAFLKRHGSHRSEATHRRKDGGVFPVALTANFVAFEGREYVFAYAQDITERRRAEEANALLQAQFLQSQKLEAIGRLAGGVAHDFNNILTAILGYADLLLDALGEAHPRRRDVMEIRLAADRAAALTRQLLAFSRRQIRAPRVVDLNEIIASAQRMIGRLIGEDVELRFVPGEHLGRVKADPTQIDQILVNLATNARDAMPKGGTLTVETSGEPATSESPTQGWVLLAVSDTGHGMDEATRAHAFEPFFTTKALGTGLGLATVRDIVGQHGGHIDLDSQPGVGTRLRIWLPAVSPGDIGAPEEPEERGAVPRGDETILLVEDDAAVRHLTKTSLEQLGYTVIEAKDAQEALELAGRDIARFDLLVTDVVLPRMHGPELYAVLKTRRPGLRHLFVSGYAEDVVASHGDLAPGVRLLQKPFSFSALALATRAALDT